jgi:hypothetical protein
MIHHILEFVARSIFYQMDVSPADPKTIYGAYGKIQVSS